MYQEWFKEYEKIINEGKKETEYCPMCGRKLKGGIAVEEIKVGDFIRSNDGYIGKITSIRQNPKRECDTYYSCDNCMASGFYEQIKKHSKNIKDLIECGDYVNGYRIDNIVNGVLVNKVVGIDKSGTFTPIVQYEKHIKTILTKEQFEQNSYKV